MKRGKKIIVLAHCILNPNAKVKGLAATSGALPELVTGLVAEGYGLLQLPCPEHVYGGCRRWGMTCEQYNTPQFRKHCGRLLEDIVDQLEEYLSDGYSITGILGMNGSPSCGVEWTCAGYVGGEIEELTALPAARKENGKGVFMNIFSSMLCERRLTIPLMGLDESAPAALSWPEVACLLSAKR